jgi:hypothetical protein
LCALQQLCIVVFQPRFTYTILTESSLSALRGLWVNNKAGLKLPILSCKGVQKCRQLLVMAVAIRASCSARALLRAFATEIPPAGLNLISGVPDKHAARSVKIFKPAR